MGKCQIGMREELLCTVEEEFEYNTYMYRLREERNPQ